MGHKFPAHSKKDLPLGMSSKMLVSQQTLAHIGAMCELPLLRIYSQACEELDLGVRMKVHGCVLHVIRPLSVQQDSWHNKQCCSTD